MASHVRILPRRSRAKPAQRHSAALRTLHCSGTVTMCQQCYLPPSTPRSIFPHAPSASQLIFGYPRCLLELLLASPFDSNRSFSHIQRSCTWLTICEMPPTSQAHTAILFAVMLAFTATFIISGIHLLIRADRAIRAASNIPDVEREPSKSAALPRYSDVEHGEPGPPVFNLNIFEEPPPYRTSGVLCNLK